MANVLCSTPVRPSVSLKSPGTFLGNSVADKFVQVKPVFQTCKKFPSLEVKAIDSSKKSTKPNSIVCAECDGNGAISCTQCKGTGVNSVDHFNGQFKAGGLCWLCRGKREILCGNCNGAGFIGGFMSTCDD